MTSPKHYNITNVWKPEPRRKNEELSVKVDLSGCVRSGTADSLEWPDGLVLHRTTSRHAALLSDSHNLHPLTDLNSSVAHPAISAYDRKS